MTYTREIFNLKCDWNNHIFTIIILIIRLIYLLEINFYKG